MSAAQIITKAEEIATLAQALPSGSGSGITFPPPVDCLAGTVPAATAHTPGNSWIDMQVRHARMQGHLRDGWIPVIGTSITQSWDVAQIHPACVNLGIGGDTFAGVLNRLASLTALSRAGAVIIELGANDAGYTQVQDISAQLDKLLGWLTGPLLVLSLIPNGNGYLSQSTMNAVNDLFTTKTANRAQCIVADVTTPLKDTDGFMKMSYSIGDRLHPNADGYSVLLNTVAPCLDQLI